MWEKKNWRIGESHTFWNCCKLQSQWSGNATNNNIKGTSDTSPPPPETRTIKRSPEMQGFMNLEVPIDISCACAPDACHKTFHSSLTYIDYHMSKSNVTTRDILSRIHIAWILPFSRTQHSIEMSNPKSWISTMWNALRKAADISRSLEFISDEYRTCTVI